MADARGEVDRDDQSGELQTEDRLPLPVGLQADRARHGTAQKCRRGGAFGTELFSRALQKRKRYHCLNVEMTVQSEPDRLDFYERLRQHPAVIMIL